MALAQKRILNPKVTSMVSWDGRPGIISVLLSGRWEPEKPVRRPVFDPEFGFRLISEGNQSF